MLAVKGASNMEAATKDVGEKEIPDFLTRMGKFLIMWKMHMSDLLYSGYRGRYRNRNRCMGIIFDPDTDTDTDPETDKSQTTAISTS